VLLVKAPHQVREHALGPFVIFGFERVLVAAELGSVVGQGPA
jgi:hypothetical protein